MCVYICHTFLIRTLQCVLSTAIMGISEVRSAVCLVYRVQMRHMQQHHTACHGHRHPNVMCAHGYPVDSVDLPRCHYRLTIRSTWLWLSVPASCLSIRLYLLFFFFFVAAAIALFVCARLPIFYPLHHFTIYIQHAESTGVRDSSKHLHQNVIFSIFSCNFFCYFRLQPIVAQRCCCCSIDSSLKGLVYDTHLDLDIVEALR